MWMMTSTGIGTLVLDLQLTKYFVGWQVDACFDTNLGGLSNKPSSQGWGRFMVDQFSSWARFGHNLVTSGFFGR